MSKGLQLAIFYIHCKDRTNGGLEHVEMYSTASDPHKDQLYPRHIHELFLKSSRHKDACGLCPLSLHNVSLGAFSTFFCVSMAMHVTA